MSVKTAMSLSMCTGHPLQRSVPQDEDQISATETVAMLFIVVNWSTAS
eukprot:jgi/Antlo1/1597/1880